MKRAITHSFAFLGGLLLGLILAGYGFLIWVQAETKEPIPPQTKPAHLPRPSHEMKQPECRITGSGTASITGRYLKGGSWWTGVYTCALQCVTVSRVAVVDAEPK